jgi:probable HAF family extracellular repeat protein
MSHLLRKRHTQSTIVLVALMVAACSGSDWMAPKASRPAGDNSGYVIATATVTDLGTLGGLTSGATSVNDQGVVVGASLVSCPTCTPKQTPTHAFRVQSGQMTDLGTLGGKSSAAKAINNNGWIVGWAHTPGNGQHASLWKPGSAAQDLGTMGGATSIAWGINKKNQIVGQSDVPSPAATGAWLRRSTTAA